MLGFELRPPRIDPEHAIGQCELPAPHECADVDEMALSPTRAAAADLYQPLDGGPR
jgi:hypothetical protein